MATTYLYGLVLARNAHLVPAHITGLGGGIVRVLECDGLGAVVSTLERPPARDSLDDIRAHDHALQSVVNHGATAAAGRFGQIFPTDEEARRYVIQHGERIARVLDEYDGCVEMRLLLAGAPEPTPPVPEPPAASAEEVGPGRAYLERVRAIHSGTDRLALRGALGPMVRAERVEELPKERGVAFAHLIERRSEAEYRDAIAALPALADGTLVGPLALYTFAEPR